MPQTPASSKDRFDKFESVSKIFSILFIPIIVLWLGNAYTSSENEKSRRSEYIKIAVGILQEKPEEEKKDIRKWAINIINQYSDVKLEDSAKKQLTNEQLSKTIDTSNFWLNNSKSIIRVNYEFLWDGDAKKAYNFELQQWSGDRWIVETGLCVLGNYIVQSVPVGKKMRWRASEGYDVLENTPWKELMIAPSY